jgi:hypothetical protein
MLQLFGISNGLMETKLLPYPRLASLQKIGVGSVPMDMVHALSNYNMINSLHA